MNNEIILKVNEKGWALIEQILLQLPGANGIHEFIEELRGQVKGQSDLIKDIVDDYTDFLDE